MGQLKMPTTWKLHGRSARHAKLLGLFALLLASTLIVSQPVRDRILEDIVVTSAEDEARVNIFFSDVFQYVTHFPVESSDELRIRLEPVKVATSSLTAVFQREAIRPLDAADAQLEEVLYEGDIPGGPYLTLFFSNPVNYEVIPGTDFRSMTILVRPVP